MLQRTPLRVHKIGAFLKLRIIGRDSDLSVAASLNTRPFGTRGKVMRIHFSRFGYGESRYLNARGANSVVQKLVMLRMVPMPVVLIARGAGVVRTRVVRIARGAGGDSQARSADSPLGEM